MKRLLLILALTGCDKLLHRDAAGSSAMSTATATETATATATATETATATATETAAAAGWPAYLPDYPGAKATKKTADRELFETKDSKDKVLAFYKQKLQAAGFPAGASGTIGTSTTLTTSKGPTMVQLTVTEQSGTTKIDVSLL